ncbi:MAG: S-layer protein domain-containing protein [Methanosarcinales archaeon]
MSKYAVCLLAISILSFVFLGIAQPPPRITPSETPPIEPTVTPIFPIAEAPIVVTPTPMEPQNYTRLHISPSYSNLQIKPGDAKEIKIKVKNPENETVATKVRIITPPYSENILDKKWITVTPNSADLPANKKQEYTIKVAIPEDAKLGYYSAMIAFTNDTVEERYVNAFYLSIRVWKPPVISIKTRYIHDRVEPGQTYTYEIQVVNIGDKAISLKPEIIRDRRSFESALPEDWINIEAPKQVKPNSNAKVLVRVKIPRDAKGRKLVIINLNLDDPPLRECDQKVQLSIEVRRPFQEKFKVGDLLLNSEIMDGGRTIVGPDPDPKPWDRCRDNTLILKEGYMLTVEEISPDGDFANISLSKNGVVVLKQMIQDGHWFYYNITKDNQTYTIFSAKLDGIFRGTESDVIQLKPFYQYSDGSSETGVLINEHIKLYEKESLDLQR